MITAVVVRDEVDPARDPADADAVRRGSEAQLG